MAKGSMIYYFIVIFGVLACSAAQLLLKQSSAKQHQSVICELLNWRVIMAYSIMFAVLIVNIYAMSHGVQLKDMPVLESLGYVFVPLLASLVLHEKTDRHVQLSMILIFSGILIFYL